MMQDVTTGTFEAEVLGSDRPVLVEFYTQWCPSCRAMEPALEALVREFEGRAKIVRIDAEAEPDLSMEYEIRAVPTMMIFKDGGVIDTMVGGRPASMLRAKLEQVSTLPVD